MELMRESWTDERLDHLNARVDEGFKQMDKRLEKLEDRFASLQLTLLAVGGGLMGTVIACSAALVATQI